MELLPLKIALFYTFLIGSPVEQETLMCARDLHVLERSFRQVNRQFWSTDAAGLK